MGCAITVQPTTTNLSNKGTEEMSKQEEISANDKFIKNISKVLSQYHSEQMSEAVKRGMLNRIKDGYSVTRPPLGYTITETPGLYELDSYGLRARSALQPLANGKTNVGMVVAYLDMFYHVKTGIEHSGITWLERILLDPYYIGYICYKSQLYPGLHEPLITEDEHEKLLILMKNQNEYNSLKQLDKNIQNHHNGSMSRMNKQWTI